jgi:hypothetical protein
VGQSFGFASELPLGPELAILPMKRREIIANRVGRKADGGAEAPALQGRFERYAALGGSAWRFRTVLPFLEFPEDLS